MTFNKRSLLSTAGLFIGLTSHAMADTHPAPTEKAGSPPTHCVSYIVTAKWVYRFNEWTLEVQPTPCGRTVQPEETAYFWDELTRDYSNSRYWTNTHGMRHQLICHLAIADNKPEWNLDPWRPDVGYALTVAAGCNPVDPLPEKAP